MINFTLSKDILERYNKKEIGRESKIELSEIPGLEHKSIIEISEETSITLTKQEIETFLDKYSLSSTIMEEINNSNGFIDFNLLNKIGVELLPLYAFGVLNGGSATSYVDRKKNSAFNSDIFSNIEDLFMDLTTKYRDRPKGITPAFIQPDQTPGPSFMELKIRALFLESEKYREMTGEDMPKPIPVFQMTSNSNNEIIADYYKSLISSPYIGSYSLDSVLSGKQPLITAYRELEDGVIDYFTDNSGEHLGLPGGHGQSFYVLKEILLNLYKQGIKFISIGNVDNIGYSVEPTTIALLALTGKQATFDFALKTPFDVKGGVLVIDNNNRLNCADLGVAVSKDDVKEAELAGKTILFNCATGYFNLEYLIDNLDRIIKELPIRFSRQNKDIGNYFQAEQVTWEVLTLLDDFLILAVNKYDRFLASKLLIENLVTCGMITDIKDDILKENAELLNNGLTGLLKNKFNLKLEQGKWITND